MRWQSLFRDLEAEFSGLERQELERQTQEQTRTQMAQIPLQNLMRANVGAHVTIATLGGYVAVGHLLEAYPQWFLLEGAAGEALIPAGSVLAVQGLNQRVAPPAGPTASALTLGHALRALARDRASVLVTTQGEAYRGIFGHVGKDWVQLRLQRPGELKPLGTEVTIPHEAVGAVQNQNRTRPVG